MAICAPDYKQIFTQFSDPFPFMGSTAQIMTRPNLVQIPSVSHSCKICNF
jgi:hypothetical protein